MQNKLFILTIALALSLPVVKGQVTIGSIKEPVKGALLDLKDDATHSGNTTSSRGLLMPRVALTNPTELYPMFEEGGVNYDTPAKKETQKKIHTGLMVYAPERFGDK